MHFYLGPFEWMRVLVVCFAESINCSADLERRSPACTTEYFSPENAEPDFHLIQPGSVSWGIVKMHVLMFS